jgi:hypothetical protein
VIEYEAVFRWEVSLVTGEGTAVADVGTEGSRAVGETKESEVASTTVTTGGVNCETEPEREVVEVVAAGDRGTGGPEPASFAVEFVVVGTVPTGVNAGNGFVTFNGEAPALRVEGDGFAAPLLRMAASLVVKDIFRSLGFSLSLSLLPTDLARYRLLLTSLFANSCELGIGGGKKVEEGDGNGDADDGVSTASVSLGWPVSVADGPTGPTR